MEIRDVLVLCINYFGSTNLFIVDDFSNKLTCQQVSEREFSCEEYCEDVFYKVGDVAKYKQYESIVKNCNPEITEKFISVKY